MLFVGGNDRSLRANRGDLVTRLLNDGHSTHAALPKCADSNTVQASGLIVHRIPLSRTGLNPSHDLRSVRAIRSLIGKLTPHTVLAYNPKPVIHTGLALRRFPNVRFVALITGRGALERRVGFKGRLAELALATLYRASLSRPDVILFQNDDDRAFFLRRFPVRSDTVVDVIPGSGVHCDRFPQVPLSADVPRFLLVAKLLVDKGVREFVQAARAVSRALPGAQFRVVGGRDPSLPHALPAAEVERWKADGLVEFIGAVDDVRPHLAWSTVLCHPSYAEGTPRAVLEAMATGRATITTDAPGCRQTIVPGESGLLVPPRNADALAEAMITLGSDQALVARMGSAARKRAVEVYDVHKVNAQIIQHLALPERTAHAP